MIQHQNVPNFKLEISEKIPVITSFAGLGILRQAMHQLGITKAMKKFFLKRCGYGDDVVLEAIILLLAAGGRSLSDWEYLSGDSGFALMFGQCPSVDTLERYLQRLEITIPDRGDSESGQVGYSTILEMLHEIMLKKAHALAGSPDKMHLDLDATLIETNKAEAEYSYENIKAYHPFSAYCPEIAMFVAHEFRDGNVSPQEGYQRLVDRCRALFPNVHWTVRSDSAGYNNKFMDHLSRKRIRYYITAEKPYGIEEYLYAKDLVWKPVISNGVTTEQEYAEIDYPVNACSNKEMKFRMRTRCYIAIRKPKKEPDLFEKYIYQIIVTNALWEEPLESIHQHRGRCGTVEYGQEQVKSQCGMDMMPSNDFKVNAAWFSLGLLTHNLLRLLQQNILPEFLRKVEIKTLRFRFLRAAAMIIKKSRSLIMRFTKSHPVYDLYQQAQKNLMLLAT